MSASALPNTLTVKIFTQDGGFYKFDEVCAAYLQGTDGKVAVLKDHCNATGVLTVDILSMYSQNGTNISLTESSVLVSGIFTIEKNTLYIHTGFVCFGSEIKASSRVMTLTLAAYSQEMKSARGERLKELKFLYALVSGQQTAAAMVGNQVL